VLIDEANRRVQQQCTTHVAMNGTHKQLMYVSRNGRFEREMTFGRPTPLSGCYSRFLGKPEMPATVYTRMFVPLCNVFARRALARQHLHVFPITATAHEVPYSCTQLMVSLTARPLYLRVRSFLYLMQRYSNFFVRVPPNVISPQLRTPKSCWFIIQDIHSL
jgi:hypothetical protein